MSNVYFDAQHFTNSRVSRPQVDTNWGHDTIVIDYPFFFELPELPISIIKTRRWCERNLQYDVFFREQYHCDKNRVTDYYWVVYFEDEKDMLHFKLGM